MSGYNKKGREMGLGGRTKLSQDLTADVLLNNKTYCLTFGFQNGGYS